MRKHLFQGVLIGSLTSSLVVVALPTMAGTGLGAVFNLGKVNKVNAASTLKGATSGKSLQLTNTGTGGGLGVTVGSGRAPITVNAAAGKATNLNVDKLDGLDSTAFARTSAFRTLTFDDSASGSPTMHLLGTVLGDTIYADCFEWAVGEAMVRVYLKTSNGAWSADYSLAVDDNGTRNTFTSRTVEPAGHYNTPMQVDSAVANGQDYQIDTQSDYIQLAPVKGHLTWHLAVVTASSPASQTCHMSVQSTPSF